MDAAVEFEMTAVMRSMWLHEQFVPGSVVNNTGAALRYRGDVDTDLLQRALQIVVDRHDVLRAHVVVRDGTPRLSVPQQSPVDFRPVDAEGWSDIEISDAVDEAILAPFDLLSGPMCRFALLSRSAAEHVLVLAVHHLVTDLWSMTLLADEIGETYERLGRGVDPQPSRPSRSFSFAEHVANERAVLDGPEADDHLAYWVGRLENHPGRIDLPLDRERSGSVDARGGHAGRSLGAETTRNIASLARSLGTSPRNIVLSAFMVLLHRYTGDSDLTLASVKAGRSMATARAQGCFVNPLLLRGAVDGAATFAETVTHIQSVVEEAETHERYPLQAVFERRPSTIRSTGRPLVNVAYMWHKTTRLGDPVASVASAMGQDGVVGEYGGHIVETVEISQRPTPYELALLASAVDDEIVLSCEFRRELFDEATIVRLLEHLDNLIEAGVSNPELPIDRLGMLSSGEVERHRVQLGSWRPAHERTTVRELFDEQVRAHPERVAVVAPDRSLSYSELGAEVARVGAMLRSRGLGRGSVVGVHLPRSSDLIVSLLAVADIGAAFLPLDPRHPVERNRARVIVAHASAVIISGSEIGVFAGIDEIPLDHAVEHPPSWDDAPEHSVRPDDPIALLFTSGTTGEPSAVTLDNHVVANLLQECRDRPGLDGDDVILAHTTPVFVQALRELLLPVVVGACAHIVSEETAGDPRLMVEAASSSGATVLSATPTMLRLMLGVGWDGGGVAAIWCGGEPMTAELANQLAVRFDRVWNTYGTTETATVAMCEVQQRSHDDVRPIPIGTPIAGVELYVLDSAGQLVAEGAVGELCVGGVVVAPSGAGSAADTERTVRHPLDDRRRLHRTQDLVRLSTAGEIVYVGRLGRRINLRGFRIDPAEVENELLAHAAITTAAVYAQPDDRGVDRLAADITVGVADRSPSYASLRAFLAERLPAHMIPAAVEVRGAPRRTSTGKLEHGAPSTPEPVQHVPPDVAPLTETEAEIARILADVLGVSSVGRSDNFFDLGGHSLLAIEAFVRIERSFGRQLPLSALIEAPTVEGLAQLIESPEWRPEWTSLVPVHAGGELRPFFYVAPFLVTVLSVANVGLQLPPDQPFYAIQPDHFDDDSSLEDVAARYLDEVRQVQPTGPYTLGGHCSGSWMAFEMARQLQALGEEVEVLVLVDVGPPGVAAPQASRTGGVLGRLRHYHRTGRVVDAVKWRLGLAWELFALPYVGRGETRRTAANRARHRRIHRRYEPAPIEGDALLVRSSEYDGLETREWHLEWSRLLSGSLSVAVVPGTHAGLVENRYARELADVIGQRLSRARTSKRLDRDPQPGVDQESVVAPTTKQESAAFR